METSKLLAQELTNSNYGYISVSHGTLRSQDLLPAFYDAFNFYRNPEDQEAEDLSNEIDTHLAKAWLEDKTADFWESELCMDFMLTLEDALGDICPEGYYFGTLEGDLSDFGFWQVQDFEE